MERGREAEHNELRARGHRALHEPLSHGLGDPAPSSASVQVTIWEEPSFHAVRSWSVINTRSGRTGEKRLLVRRVTWDQMTDRQRLGDPMMGLREGFHTRPTIEVDDVDLGGAQWLARRSELEGLSLSPIGWGGAPRNISIDGVGYGIRVLEPVRIELEWSNNPPEGWSALAAWVTESTDWFELALQ